MSSDVRFLSDREAITAALHRLIHAQPDEQPVYLGVAFWGDGAEQVLIPSKRFRLVCNLSSGGTNPAVIERLSEQSGVEVRQRPKLHAKVVVTESGALVSSANVSSLGLALANSTSGWIEAGLELPASNPAYADVRRWAEAIWASAGEVTPELLDAARERFQPHLPQPSPGDTEPDGETAQLMGLPDFGLRYDLLFGPPSKGNPKNPLKAPSDLLEQLYGNCLGRPLNKRDAYIPRYIAHLLWTHAGNAVDWRDGTFERPADVVSAWRRPGVRVKDEVVHDFLVWLANAEDVPSPIRLACRDLLDTAWNQALLDATNASSAVDVG